LEVLEGGRLVEISGPKRQALLALLALRDGRVLSVDVAVDALWGAEFPTAPRNAVQHHVTRLRSALGRDALVAVDDGYALVGADVDALRFEDLLAAARKALADREPWAARALAAQALALWRGPALLGLRSTSWADAEAARLEALRVDALEEQFDAVLALGEHVQIASAIRSALDEDPFRERLWGQLMLALYRGGRQAEALDAYRRARAVLDEQLGLEPGPDLQRLQAAILVHDPILQAAPDLAYGRGNLPSPLSSFVGRAGTVKELRTVLRDQRLVTLTGPPGVGKSRLALETARTLREEATGGVWLVQLGSAESASDVPHAVVQALGIQAVQKRRAALDDDVAALRARRALLVLDGCDRMVGEAARVAATILARCPHVRVLATSREALHLTGEYRMAIPPLEDSEAVRLFAERARAARPGFELGLDDTRKAAEICRRLDGLPLAIELAAARVAVLGLGEILASLDRRFVLLTAGDRSAPDQHRSLAALIAWSYDLLRDDERALLQQLAVFRGGASHAALAESLAPAGLSGDAVTELLGALVDKSIVLASFPDGAARYSLLETVREFVLERVAESPRRRRAVRAAHASYFAAAAAAASTALAQTPESGVRQLELEDENLWEALAFARDTSDPELAVRLGSALGWSFAPTGRIAEGRDFLGLARSLATGEAASARLLELLAQLTCLATLDLDLDAALEAGEHAFALAERATPRERALVRAALVLPLALRGDRDRAIALFREARSFGPAAADRSVDALLALSDGVSESGARPSKPARSRNGRRDDLLARALIGQLRRAARTRPRRGAAAASWQ
jgi:predicted ATPase/DNA-binding SARP family transcriptional activator